ncbi:CoA pyrophosphatase [Clostridiaceae bacterium UIB06]|uniref:CoA pyrophosphatase n=1 Tax=Clostridium thailandense TaxID=2794346 RepID=A0A949X2E5_9CLOT|nr:CoA pyrophosphatase [Clostridium thailandense]MBV7273154.1 CoA pyrophosphatase [Clostridium thailandense]MCH5137520.1 CoA pyrophosphatase [Clostridiaceae bacterium UIB06]
MIDKIKNIFMNREEEMIGTYNKSAVMILLCEENDKTNIIFEVRSLNLRHQPGDICLPGGKIEKNETPQEASIRESMEELNLKREDIEFIGNMDYIVTPYNFIIYPFIARITKSEINPNNSEVDHVFKVPLQFFLENYPKLYQLSITSDPGDEFPYHLIRNGKNYKFRTGKVPEYFYKYDNYIIWGFTALIIKAFVDIIKNDAKKEGHLI